MLGTKETNTKRDDTALFASLIKDAASSPESRKIIVPKLIKIAENVKEIDINIHLPVTQYNECSFLHLSALFGSQELVSALLLRGALWNAVDCNLKSVGDYCLESGNKDLYNYLVEEGTRTELLLAALNDYQNEDEYEDDNQ